MWLLTSTGEDVLQSDGHHRGVSGAGQWSRRGLQTETSHTLASVHWTGVPGDLLDLHGEFVHLITETDQTVPYFVSCLPY